MKGSRTLNALSIDQSIHAISDEQLILGRVPFTSFGVATQRDPFDHCLQFVNGFAHRFMVTLEILDGAARVTAVHRSPDRSNTL